jgi:hypothetical protein
VASFQSSNERGCLPTILLRAFVCVLPLGACDTLKIYRLTNVKTGASVACVTGLNEPITKDVELRFESCIATCKSRGYVADTREPVTNVPMSFFADEICKEVAEPNRFGQ